MDAINKTEDDWPLRKLQRETNKILHSIVPIMYDSGKIDEEEYKKYLLSEDPSYFPLLKDKYKDE